MYKSIARPWQSLVVVGGVALDITSTHSVPSALHTSLPGTVRQSLGGVGRNVAEAAMRTGAKTYFVSLVGNDIAGASIRQGMEAIGMTTRYLSDTDTHATAVYNALHSHQGQLISAVADMDILGAMDPHKIHQTIADIGAGMVCVDGNLSALTLHAIVVECSKRKIPVFFEPTSVPKSVRLLENPETLACGAVQFISPNQYELEAMVDTAKRTLPPMTLDIWQKIDGPRVAQQMLPLATYLSHSIPNVITKLGEDGCLYVQNKASHVAYFPPETVLPEQIKSVTGAGDCFVGTLLANLMHSRPHPVPWSALIQQSQKSSVLTLQSALAVSQSISDALLVKS